DVSTSPSYDLVVTITVGIIGLAASTAARALVAVWRQTQEQLESLQTDLKRLQLQAAEFVTRAPSHEVVVASATGRIVNASTRFRRTFALPEAAGAFLLDCVGFAYPAVVRRLIGAGGEDVQSATVQGRDTVLRVRAETVGEGASQVTIMNIEPCEELCWR